jgi:hypothetical protein
MPGKVPLDTLDGRLKAAAKHDLIWEEPVTQLWYGVPLVLGAIWDHKYGGLATDFTPDSKRQALANRKRMLEMNPHMVFLLEVRWRDAPGSFLPEDSPFWKRNPDGTLKKREPAPDEKRVRPPDQIPNPERAQAQGGAGGGPRKQIDEMAPFLNSIYDAGVWWNTSESDLTFFDVTPGKPRDLPLYRGGNLATPTELAPRGFPLVLTKSAGDFTHGSGRLEDNVAAHRVADQNRLAQAELLNHRLHVLAEGSHGPLLTLFSRLPVAGQIERHDAVSFCELGDLVVPKSRITHPTVDEHDRRRTAALGVVTNGRAVEIRARGAIDDRWALVFLRRVGANRQGHGEHQRGQDHVHAPPLSCSIV